MSFSKFKQKVDSEISLRDSGELPNSRISKKLSSPAGKSLQYPHDLFDPDRGVDPPFIMFVIKDPVVKSAEIKRYITMYLPAQLTTSYGAVYNEIERSIKRFFKGAERLQGSLSTAAGEAKAFLESGSFDFGKLGNASAEVVASIGNDSTIGQEIQRALGKTVNPHQALVFRNVAFRSFKFDFHLMARNAQEAEEIQLIIQAFKEAMHPEGEQGADSFFWLYPDNIDIFLFTPSDDRMFKIDTSVLTDMSVDYAGAGIPSFFEDGAPVDIRMSLSFKELSVLTKEKIRKGF